VDLLLRHFWVVLLAFAVANAFRQRRRVRERVREDPSLEPGTRRSFVRSLVFGSLPWLVMGLGIVVGGVEGVQDYLHPRRVNPWVLLFWGTTLLLWAWGVVWVFFLGGAQKLVDHPELGYFPVRKPGHVKAYAVAGSIIGIVVVLVVFGVDLSVDLFSGGTADGYRTVFVVYDGFWKVVGIALLFMGIGVGTLIASIVRLRRQRAQAEPVEPKKRWNARFLLVWSILWLGGGGTAFALNLRESYRLVRAYAEGRTHIAEGTVRVLREQPEGGHAPGDRVAIGGTELTIDYFSLSPAYTKTIAHGGVLREGVHVRVWHHEGNILRVDVAEARSP